MRKINKIAAIAMLAAIATFSMPQSAKAGLLMSDRANQVTNQDKTGILLSDRTGMLLSDYTGILLSDFTQALTGIMLSD